MSSSQVHTIIQHAGLDIGFFSTKFTLGKRQGPLGSELLVDQFPSLATKSPQKILPQLPNTEPLDAVVVEVDDVDYIVGKSVLSMVGAAGGARAQSLDFCLTPAYKSLFLGALYYMAKHRGGNGNLVINHMVVGLPLNTVFIHAEFLKKMVMGEHLIPCPGQPGRMLTVKVNHVIVVAQPQGAVVNFTSGLDRKIKPKEHALVLDMGGGTFDWFICNGNYAPNYMLCGAAPIGALAFAALICDRIKPGLKNQPRVIEKVDEALRSDDLTFRITGVDYNVSDYWPLVTGLLEESLQQMMMQVGALDTIDHILLTGGGAGILKKIAQTRLAAYKKIMVMDEDPVYSNAKGFYRIAEMMGRS